MKKLVTIALTLILALTLAACGGAKQPAGPDLSKFPKDLKEWSATDYNNYFIAAGVYDEKIGYVQDHATYWFDTPVCEGSGAMDDAGDVMVFIFTFDPAAQDADVPAFMEELRTSKAFPEELSGLPMDHMAANACFCFQFSGSEEVYQAAEKAFQDLMTAMKVTPDF